MPYVWYSCLWVCWKFAMVYVLLMMVTQAARLTVQYINTTLWNLRSERDLSLINYRTVPCCTWVYPAVPGCTLLYLGVPCCTLGVPCCTWVYPAVPGCTLLYPGCTLLYPGCTLLYPGCALLYLGVHSCTWKYPAVPGCAVGAVPVLAAAGLLPHLPLHKLILVEALHLEGEDLWLPLLHLPACSLHLTCRRRARQMRVFFSWNSWRSALRWTTSNTLLLTLWGHFKFLVAGITLLLLAVFNISHKHI